MQIYSIKPKIMSAKNIIHVKKQRTIAAEQILRFAAESPQKPLLRQVGAFLHRHEVKLVGAAFASALVALPLQFVFPPIWLVPLLLGVLMIAKVFLHDDI